MAWKEKTHWEICSDRWVRGVKQSIQGRMKNLKVKVKHISSSESSRRNEEEQQCSAGQGQSMSGHLSAPQQLPGWFFPCSARLQHTHWALRSHRDTGKGWHQPPQPTSRNVLRTLWGLGCQAIPGMREGEKPTAWKCRLENCQAEENHVHVANPVPTCFWSDKS